MRSLNYDLSNGFVDYINLMFRIDKRPHRRTITAFAYDIFLCSVSGNDIEVYFDTPNMDGWECFFDIVQDYLQINTDDNIMKKFYRINIKRYKKLLKGK